MICEDHVFVVDVVVTNLTWETMVTSVINQLANASVKSNTTVKIRKYGRLHKRHHFILMAMEVHGALGHDIDCFIKECVHLFYNRWLGGHLSLSFCIQFFRQHVSIAFQCVLTSTIERKIALTGDACSRPPINIKYHNLHASDIRGAMHEIASYH